MTREELIEDVLRSTVKTMDDSLGDNPPHYASHIKAIKVTADTITIDTNLKSHDRMIGELCSQAHLYIARHRDEQDSPHYIRILDDWGDQVLYIRAFSGTCAVK